MSATNRPLLEVSDLVKHFPLEKGLIESMVKRDLQVLKAVDGISFSVEEGETFGLVGESGCGKTTAGRSVLRLYEPTSGRIVFDGNELMELTQKQMNPLRADMQIIFQDPYSSLNPRMTVSQIITYPMKVQGKFTEKEMEERVDDLLKETGLNVSYRNRFPHEFSGGQRQRIGIARALALEPRFIVADEPVTALDVSVQAQILNLLKQLQQDHGHSYLFIAHDLSVIRHMSHSIGVMYLGKIVETANKKTLFTDPQHPYTKSLLSAIPNPNPDLRGERIHLEGEIPSPINPPPGCKFHTRCSMMVDVCREVEPEWRELEDGHYVACHMVK